MSDSSKSLHRQKMPRQESQPRTWSQLTEEQQEVVCDIHEWCCVFSNKNSRRRPEKRATRSNGRSILSAVPTSFSPIDGGRGSGKTSVMLSILRLWNELLGQNRDWSKEWTPLQDTLERLKGRIITVPILDLEPLPASTSLLPWIAGRVLKLGEDIETHSSRSSGTPNKRGKWAPEYEQEPAWKKAWRELLQDAAAGWTERVAHPRGALDTEAFAIELEQENLARLSLLSRWRQFVSEVLTSATMHFGHLLKEDVRLVISIDDADMNPLRCAELLRLLRLLWHPRVVFMLTGHSDLFHKTLLLQIHGVFRQLHHGNHSSNAHDVGVDALPPTAETLAFQIYDKAIPPQQRFALPSLDLEQRLRLLRTVLDVPLRQRSDARCPNTLSEYLELNPYVLPALPKWLREIQNFRQVALNVGAQGANAIAHALWRDALAEEYSQLPVDYASKVHAMVGLLNGKIRSVAWITSSSDVPTESSISNLKASLVY